MKIETLLREGESGKQADHRDVAGKPTAPVWDQIANATDGGTISKGVRTGGFRSNRKTREMLGIDPGLTPLTGPPSLQDLFTEVPKRRGIAPALCYLQTLEEAQAF
jgi:hypothetical protein